MKQVILFFWIFFWSDFLQAQAPQLFTTIDTGCQNSISSISIDSIKGHSISDLQFIWNLEGDVQSGGRVFARQLSDTTKYDVKLKVLDERGRFLLDSQFFLKPFPVPSFKIRTVEPCPGSVANLEIVDLSIREGHIFWEGDQGLWNHSGNIQNPSYLRPVWIFFSDGGCGPGCGNFRFSVRVTDGRCGTLKNDTLSILPSKAWFSDTSYYRSSEDSIRISTTNLSSSNYIKWTLFQDSIASFSYDSETLPLAGLQTNVEYSVWAYVEDMKGCADITKRYNFKIFPLAVQETRKATLNSFPNPCTDKIYLMQLEPNSVVEVWGIDGRRINSRTLYGQELDLTDLASGVYLLKQNNQCAKIVKQ